MTLAIAIGHLRYYRLEARSRLARRVLSRVMAWKRRLGAARTAAAWVSRRFVAMPLVVMVVLFELVLWRVTAMRYRPCTRSSEARSCTPEELRRALERASLPWNRHEAVFWLLNAFLLAATAGTVATMLLVRRARAPRSKRDRASRRQSYLII